MAARFLGPASLCPASLTSLEQSTNNTPTAGFGPLYSLYHTVQLVCVAGYFQYQFSGVLRRIKVNNQLVNLSDLPTQGQVEILPCSAAEVQDFITYMKEEQENFQNLIGHGPRP